MAKERFEINIINNYKPTKNQVNVKYIQCNSLYIDQTCRFSHTRMLEYARSIKNYNTNKHEQNFKKRLCLEMIHIKKNNNY